MRLLTCLLLAAVLGAAAPAYAQDSGDAASQPAARDKQDAQDKDKKDAPKPDSTASADDAEIDLGVVNVEGTALPPPQQDQPQSEPDVVEVQTAPPAPDTAQVLNRDELESRALDTVDRVLERESGFVVNDTFAGSAVTYHGLPGKFSTVTIDGQRLPGHIFDQVDFGQLPLGDVGAVQILRGPQTAAFGPDSAGVIINLVPLRPEGRGGEATLGVGSFGYNRQRLRLFNGNAKRDWDFNAERELREAYDLNSLFPDTDGDSYRNYDFAGSYNERFGANELRLRAEYFNQNSDGRGFSPPNLIRTLDTDTRRWQATGSYRWQLGCNDSLTLSQNYGVYDHDLARYFAAFPGTLQDTGFTDTLWDSRLGWQRDGRATWQAGVERSFDRLVSDRITSGQAQQTSYGGYLTATWPYNDWTFDAAVRVDSPAGFATRVTPKLGATLKLDSRTALTFGAGQGYRAPSLRERHYEFASPFGYTVLGNPDLQPELSTSYTIDWLRQTEGTRIAVGAFQHDVSNLITFSETQAVPQVFHTENVGHARSSGMTLGLERRWRVGGCPQCGARYVGAGYDGTWLPRSVDSDLGTRLANAPRLDHALRAFYETPGVQAEALWHAVATRYLDRENLTPAPAYSTLDLSLDRKVGDSVWRLSALDVLDVKDGRFGPEPGRELRVEYTLKF